MLQLPPTAEMTPTVVRPTTVRTPVVHAIPSHMHFNPQTSQQTEQICKSVCHRGVVPLIQPPLVMETPFLLTHQKSRYKLILPIANKSAGSFRVAPTYSGLHLVPSDYITLSSHSHPPSLIISFLSQLEHCLCHIFLFPAPRPVLLSSL